MKKKCFYIQKEFSKTIEKAIIGRGIGQLKYFKTIKDTNIWH